MSQTDAKTLYLHALTPIHSGVGQMPSIVDLPIAREKSTGWPVLPGSCIKGVLRDRYAKENWAGLVFGTPPDGASQGSAGTVSFTDLRLLCLPVRSFHGTFGWVTCPLALARFLRDAAALGVPPPFAAAPDTVDATAALVGDDTLAPNGKVYLEDIDLDARRSDEAVAIGAALARAVAPEQTQPLVARFAIVSDAVFDFLCETATEVVARVALEEGQKTVRKGGLWYEEAVPAEALFCGWAVANLRGDASGFWSELSAPVTIQVGGDTSVGRGLCRLVVTP